MSIRSDSTALRRQAWQKRFRRAVAGLRRQRQRRRRQERPFAIVYGGTIEPDDHRHTAASAWRQCSARQLLWLYADTGGIGSRPPWHGQVAAAERRRWNVRCRQSMCKCFDRCLKWAERLVSCEYWMAFWSTELHSVMNYGESGRSHFVTWKKNLTVCCRLLDAGVFVRGLRYYGGVNIHLNSLLIRNKSSFTILWLWKAGRIFRLSV